MGFYWESVCSTGIINETAMKSQMSSSISA